MHTELTNEMRLASPARRSVSDLCHLAASGLVQMLDRENQLFCFTFIREGAKMIRRDHSHRYTMMTLLGLHKYEQAESRSLIDTVPILDGLIRDTSWITGAGDLGLLLWTVAELAPEKLAEVYESVEAEKALTRFNDGKRGSTMEVAWYLTGLASCCLEGLSDLPELREQVATAAQVLKGNCNTFGIYGHVSRSADPMGYLRHRIGSFADQVYPTIAFAKLAIATSDSKACEMSLRTSRTMCALQGAMGEWHWQYDAARGRVISKYPVFSVHQHAMGPMMLFAAEQAAGCDFNKPIYKGLEWIYGSNELRQNFVDGDLNLVWRCICLPKRRAYLQAAKRFAGVRVAENASRLDICYECRPYELGWLLYAFSGK